MNLQVEFARIIYNGFLSDLANGYRTNGFDKIGPRYISACIQAIERNPACSEK